VTITQRDNYTKGQFGVTTFCIRDNRKT